MTPLETLKAARQLISDPAKWTQGKGARMFNLKPVFARDPAAVCWCSMGAIYKQCTDQDRSTSDFAFSVLDKKCWNLHGISAVNFNDTHTHAEVLALFDAAIAELEVLA